MKLQSTVYYMLIKFYILHIEVTLTQALIPECFYCCPKFYDLELQLSKIFVKIYMILQLSKIFVKIYMKSVTYNRSCEVILIFVKSSI